MSNWFVHHRVLYCRLIGSPPSLARCADRVLEIDDEADVLLRPSSLTVRLHSDDPATDFRRMDRLSIDGLAAQHGLTLSAEGFTQWSSRIHCTDIEAASSFWACALGLEPINCDELLDIEFRSPSADLVTLTQPRPARSRIHFDVAAPLDGDELVQRVLSAGGRKGVAPWSYADPDGTEVDVIGREPAHPDYPDWVVMFTGVVRYQGHTEAVRRAMTAMSEVAVASGFEVAIDACRDSDRGRRATLTIDTGKDRWMLPGFAQVAAHVEAIAREHRLELSLPGLHFLQYGIDAIDVEAVRSFWAAVSRWQPVATEGLTDLLDPDLTGPSFIVQEMEPDPVRQAQPNRVDLVMLVAPDVGQARVDAALAAGGQVISTTTTTGQRPVWLLSDPEGNLVEIQEASRVTPS